MSNAEYQRTLIKPILRRVIVFTVPEKNRMMVKGGGMLYLPNKRYGSLTSCQKIWIFEGAKDCKFGPNKGKWRRGDIAYIHDGFELSPVDLNLWNTYKNDDEFFDLRQFAEAVDGEVQTSVISEGSIIATEESLLKTELDLVSKEIIRPKREISQGD